MANNEKVEGVIPEEVLSKAKEFMNEVYLYCEDNNIKKGLVMVDHKDDNLNIVISKKIEKEHQEHLQKMANDFEKEILELVGEEE